MTDGPNITSTGPGFAALTEAVACLLDIRSRGPLYGIARQWAKGGGGRAKFAFSAFDGERDWSATDEAGIVSAADLPESAPVFTCPAPLQLLFPAMLPFWGRSGDLYRPTKAFVETSDDGEELVIQGDHERSAKGDTFTLVINRATRLPVAAHFHDDHAGWLRSFDVEYARSVPTLE